MRRSRWHAAASRAGRADGRAPGRERSPPTAGHLADPVREGVHHRGELARQTRTFRVGQNRDLRGPRPGRERDERAEVLADPGVDDGGDAPPWRAWNTRARARRSAEMLRRRDVARRRFAAAPARATTMRCARWEWSRLRLVSGSRRAYQRVLRRLVAVIARSGTGPEVRGRDRE